MAGTYGASNLNYYTIPDLKGDTYYNIVNASTGVTSVYRRGVGGDPFVASYNPSTGILTPNKTEATSFELAAFTKPETLQIIKTQAITTAKRGGATNAQQLISPNSANPGAGQTPPAEIPTGNASPYPTTGEFDEVYQLKSPNIRIIKENYITYPEKLNVKQQDFIKFAPYELTPRTGVTTGKLGFEYVERSFGETPVDGSVYMAIQAPISDQNSVDWGPNTINAIESAIFYKSLEAMKTSSDQLGNLIQRTSEDIYSTMREQGGRLLRNLAGQAAGVNNILARSDNIVLNPNLELLFQGPQLRPFSFIFKLSARSKPEADNIKTIIKFFKYHMSSRKETSGIFLRAPHVFKIEYFYNEIINQNEITKEHPGINKIKQCALTNFSVDYTPLGSYMTYNDGTMVAYTLNLQFQELIPIYADDYNKNDPIGY